MEERASNAGVADLYRKVRDALALAPNLRSSTTNTTLVFLAETPNGHNLRQDAPGRVTVVSYVGIKFARDAGIDVWHLAGSMAFQHVIHDHGSAEEQQRLRDMKVGYPW